MKHLAPILLLVALSLSMTACAPQASEPGADGSHQVVPDVVGIPDTEATALLEEAGFVVGDITTDVSDTLVSGTVLSQEPIAGTSAPRDSAVDLVVVGP